MDGTGFSSQLPVGCAIAVGSLHVVSGEPHQWCKLDGNKLPVFFLCVTIVPLFPLMALVALRGIKVFGTKPTLEFLIHCACSVRTTVLI